MNGDPLDEERPVLGPPPTMPESLWESAMGALDVGVPDYSLLPDDAHGANGAGDLPESSPFDGADDSDADDAGHGAVPLEAADASFDAWDLPNDSEQPDAHG